MFTSTPQLIAVSLTWLAVCALPTASAQQARLDDRYGVEGFSQPARISQVAGKASGILARLGAKEGQEVSEGAVLASLECSVQEKRLELARLAMEAQGEVQGAQIEFKIQQARLDSIRNLAKRGSATEVELRQAEADFDAAQATVLRTEERQQQLRAEYERQLAECEQYVVRAPFDGVIIDYAREVGEFVGPGEPHICTIAQLSTLSVEFLLPRSLRASVANEQRVKVVFTVEDREIEGIITYISPFPNGETNTYVVKVQVENRDGRLSAGERCLLAIDDSATSDQVTYVGR